MRSIPRHGLRVVSAEPAPAELVEVYVFDLLDGPTVQELDEIEAESAVIAAGLDVLDVEISLLDRTATELDARRLRRARRRLIAAEVAAYGLATDTPTLAAVAA